MEKNEALSGPLRDASRFYDLWYRVRDARLREGRSFDDAVAAAEQAVADEAVMRYHAALPPGDEGLVAAFAAASVNGPGLPANGTARGIAAAFDLHRRRSRDVNALAKLVEIAAQ